MLPTQTAPHCECGQAATGLPPVPLLLLSNSISLKPSNLHSPTVLLPLSLQELQASPGDIVLCPLLLPALSFLSSKFLFISHLLALGVIVRILAARRARLLSRQVLCTQCRGGEWVPTRCSPRGEETLASGQLKAPLSLTSSSQNLQSCNCNRFTWHEVLFCVYQTSAYIEKGRHIVKYVLAQVQNTAFNLWGVYTPCSGHASTVKSSDPIH